jgi:iron(III) transport system substrate-binding protein
MIVQSHQQVSETLTRGERLVAAEGSDAYAWLDRKAGHKVQTVVPTDGAFLIAAPTMVIKGAAHPNAAKALAEFMISDAVQKLAPGEGLYAARSDIEPPAGNPPLAQIKLIPVDYDQVEKDAKTLKTRFNEIFQETARGRRAPPRAAPQRTATGATVEPEPPWIFSGCIMKANS